LGFESLRGCHSVATFIASVYVPLRKFCSPAISAHVRIIDSNNTCVFNLRGSRAPKGNSFNSSLSMKTTWTVAAALFFFSIFASGQDRPSWEIFGGYQYTYSDYGPIQDVGTAIASNYGQTVNVDHVFTMTGGNVTLQKNIGNHWAAAIDIGGMSASKDADLSQYFQLLGYIPNGTTQVSTFKPNVYTIMAGPQFSLWKYRNAEIFLRGMGGALRSTLSMDETTRKALNFLSPKYKTTTTDTAVMAGAGVQYPVYHQIFIRASADYIHPFSTSSQNYLRISAGIGFAKIGKLF
jgi:hypothetical protein